MSIGTLKNQSPIMHSFICKHNIQEMGVSLPAWSDTSIGNVIAFIHSDETVLKRLG
ncbi:MAG: CRISPR-associated endonuclease Csy4 [Cognaticolwellia sp.]|jgi:CRISPR-associated endonuclease Csy4